MKGLVLSEERKVELRSDLEMPVPQKGEILVKIVSASVNPFDNESANGRFDEYFKEYNVDKEIQTGLEFSGVVESSGEHFVSGESVFGYVHMITGWKTHAEYIAVDENYVAHKPDNISFPEAASLPLGSLTTLIALRELGNVKFGSRILINGAAGGLGVMAVQIGTKLGAKVDAIAGSNQGSYLKNFGAQNVYDYTKKELVDLKHNYDVIFDLTNRRSFSEVAHLLTADGVFIPAEPNDENGGTTTSKHIGYLMVTNGDREKLTEIASWAKEGTLIPVVDKIYSFRKHLEAFSRMYTKGRRGRTILCWLHND